MTGDDSRPKRLLAVAGEGGARSTRLHEMADRVRAGGEGLTPSQLAHLGAVLAEAVETTEEAERRALAETLAGAPAAPRALVLMLAADVFAVAEPLLRASPVFEEEDLLRLAERASHDHRQAIAARAGLPERVAAELVGRGDERVLLALIDNSGAEISAETMTRLVGRARTLPSLHAPLLKRAGLTAAHLTRIYFFASPPLKREILKRAEAIDEGAVAQAVTDNRRSLLSSPGAPAGEDGESSYQLLRRRTDRSAVTETLLNELINEGRLAEFRLAFSYFAGVGADAGEEILRDHSWEALLVACRAAGLDRATFASVAARLLDGGAEHNRAVRALDVYNRIPPDAAEAVMRFWRVGGAANAAPPGDPCTKQIVRA